MNFSSLHYLIIAITSSSLYQLDYQLTLASFRAKILRITCELKQFALIVNSWKLLADQRLSNLVEVKREGFPHILQKKATEKSHKWSSKKDGWSDTA